MKTITMIIIIMLLACCAACLIPISEYNQKRIDTASAICDGKLSYSIYRNGSIGEIVCIPEGITVIRK